MFLEFWEQTLFLLLAHSQFLKLFWLFTAQKFFSEDPFSQALDYSTAFAGIAKINPKFSVLHCFFKCINEKCRHITTGLLLDLLKTGGAGNVYFGDATANHIHTCQQQAALLQDGAQRMRQFKIAL